MIRKFSIKFSKKQKSQFKNVIQSKNCNHEKVSDKNIFLCGFSLEHPQGVGIVGIVGTVGIVGIVGVEFYRP